MKVFLSFMILFSSYAWALEKQKPQVLLIDEDISPATLKKDYDVHRGSTFKSSLPDKEERDTFLISVAEARGWEEFKKDRFYMDLKSKSLGDLTRRYPEFKSSRLKALKEKRK